MHCVGTIFSNYTWQNSDVAQNFCVHIWNLHFSVRLKIWFPFMLPYKLLVGLFFYQPATQGLVGSEVNFEPLLDRKDSWNYRGVCSFLDTAVPSLTLTGQTPCFVSSADSAPSILLNTFSLGFMRGITTRMSWAGLVALIVYPVSFLMPLLMKLQGLLCTSKIRTKMKFGLRSLSNTFRNQILLKSTGWHCTCSMWTDMTSLLSLRFIH